jgi:hypothetical protein
VIDKRHVDCDRNCLKWTVIDMVPQSDCYGQFQSDCDRHNGCHVDCDRQTSARLGVVRHSPIESNNLSMTVLLRPLICLSQSIWN